MKKTLLVVGKQSQLGLSMKFEIIAFLIGAKLIKEKEEVEFSTNLSEPVIIKQKELLKVQNICLVGLKATVIPSYIKKIMEKAPENETVECTVLCPEGQLDLQQIELPANGIVNLFTSMKETKAVVFSKQKEAA